MMKVNTKRQAWNKVNEIFPTDYMLDSKATNTAGYPVYRSTLKDDSASNYHAYYCYICDLGNEIEVTITFRNWKSKTVRVMVDPDLERQEGQKAIAKALEIMSAKELIERAMWSTYEWSDTDQSEDARAEFLQQGNALFDIVYELECSTVATV